MDTRESLNPQPIPNDRLPRPSTEYHYEHEDSREIHRDIERTRSLMDETIDELTARLQPAELVKGLWSYLKSSSASGSGRARERVGHAASSLGHSVSSGVRTGVRSSARAGSEAAATLGHSLSSGVRTGSEAISEGVQEGTELVVDCIRRNPVPSALVGAGLGYFFYNEFFRENRQESPSSQRLIMPGYEPEERMEEELLCEPSMAGMSTSERSIVLPAGSDIESAKYPLEMEGEDRSGSDGSPFASKAAQRAGAVGSAASAAASSTRHAFSSAGHTAGEAASQAASSVGEAASAASHAAGSAAASARRATYGAMRDTGRSVSHAASATYQGAYRGASTVGEATVEGLRVSGRAINQGAAYTRDATKEATEQYPLLVGLGCAALGMMAGFLLPRTRREDETFGETSQSIRDRGYEMGTEAVERGREVASVTVAHAMERAEQEGLTPSAIADHAGNVMKRVAESAKEAMHEEGLTSEDFAHKTSAVTEEIKETAKKEVSK